MLHQFDVRVAKVYGVDEAIMLNNIRFWILKNKANHKHFYEGKYWTYNSMRAFQTLFPYWTHRQIERILGKLIESGALIKGCFNENKLDRTAWYTLTEEAENIFLGKTDVETNETIFGNNKEIKQETGDNSNVNNDENDVNRFNETSNYISQNSEADFTKCVNLYICTDNKQTDSKLTDNKQTVTDLTVNSNLNNYSTLKSKIFADAKKNEQKCGIAENEHFFENEILNPSSFPNWRAECNSFLKDEYFKKNFCKEHKIPLGNLEELMREFVKKLKHRK